MKVKFWGVRGSLPTPLSPDQVRSKIAAVVQRIRPSDLESARSARAFPRGASPVPLRHRRRKHHLPRGPHLTAGLIIIDGGSGLRDLGVSLEKRRDPVREFPIFFTHFHWDHLQGIPFFGPAWVKGNRLIFASPVPSVERIIRDQMRPPYFPVTMDAMPATLPFRVPAGGQRAHRRRGGALEADEPPRAARSPTRSRKTGRA